MGKPACCAHACPQFACSMLGMHAHTCWSSDTWGMHEIWQAHPDKPCLPQDTVRAVQVNNTGNIGRTFSRGVFRAASAYPGPPDTGASELHHVTPLLEPGQQTASLLERECRVSGSPTMRLSSTMFASHEIPTDSGRALSNVRRGVGSLGHEQIRFP